MSNATCLMRPHLFSACFAVSRITTILTILCATVEETSVRQVALDKWCPLILTTPIPRDPLVPFRVEPSFLIVCLFFVFYLGALLPFSDLQHVSTQDIRALDPGSVRVLLFSIVCIYIYIYICMYICMHACMYVYNIYIYIYIISPP